MIYGEKVLLRTVEERDDMLLQSLMHDQEIVKVTGGYGKMVSGVRKERSLRRLSEDSGSLYCVIADREHTGTGLGILMLSPVDDQEKAAELYIKLIRSARGRGYGRDAVRTLVSYAFCGLGLQSIKARVLEYNTASRRLFEACGFLQKGVCRGSADREGRCRRVYIYRIRKDGA